MKADEFAPFLNQKPEAYKGTHCVNLVVPGRAEPVTGFVKSVDQAARSITLWFDGKEETFTIPLPVEDAPAPVIAAPGKAVAKP